MPKWLDNAIFYEIYPQTFLDTNGDGIGDFQGIIRKLDYIKELGCNAIWLNPCFVSPFSDAGYDVADYYTAAPRYGTNEDAKRLFEEVHKRGMHVLLDLVPGHTSVEHPWFQAACEYLAGLAAGEEITGETCPYAEYYHFSREQENENFSRHTERFHEASFLHTKMNADTEKTVWKPPEQVGIPYRFLRLCAGRSVTQRKSKRVSSFRPSGFPSRRPEPLSGGCRYR